MRTGIAWNADCAWRSLHSTLGIFTNNLHTTFLAFSSTADILSLEPPPQGGSNEYPQSMLLSRNKKNNVYSCKPQFYYIKVGFKGRGSKLYRYVFVMVSQLKTEHIFVNWNCIRAMYFLIIRKYVVGTLLRWSNSGPWASFLVSSRNQ